MWCSSEGIESTGRIAEIKYPGTTLRGSSMLCLRTTPSLHPGAEKDSGMVCENVICVFQWGNLGISTMHTDVSKPCDLAKSEQIFTAAAEDTSIAQVLLII